MNSTQGLTDNPPFTQNHWTQSQPQTQMMNGMSPYPTSAYPNAVSTLYGAPQQYNSARPSRSFFQPQQSFQSAQPGEMLTSMPIPDSNFSQQAEFNEAPTWDAGQPSSSPMLVPGNTWNTAPALNASYGISTPAAQISGVPVVPAF